jgi:hypothetical protein
VRVPPGRDALGKHEAQSRGAERLDLFPGSASRKGLKVGVTTWLVPCKQPASAFFRIEIRTAPVARRRFARRVADGIMGGYIAAP